MEVVGHEQRRVPEPLQLLCGRGPREPIERADHLDTEAEPTIVGHSAQLVVVTGIAASLAA